MALVEISVDSTDSALAAEDGGAHRIELCSGLREGGLTPSLGLLRAVRSRCTLPLFVIIRPRGGDFLYSREECEVMQQDIRIACEEGVQGVVLGLLTAAGEVDVARTQSMVELARPLEVTFHRALDMTRDPDAALEDVIRTGAHRVLTSGGHPSAWAGRDRLRAMVERAGGRIHILAGGGVRPKNAAALMEHTGATELHSSMRRVVPSPMQFRAEQMQLGQDAIDEYSRSVVLAADVRQLVQAAARP